MGGKTEFWLRDPCREGREDGLGSGREEEERNNENPGPRRRQRKKVQTNVCPQQKGEESLIW